MLNLNDREWKAFCISDIFIIKAGKRLTSADMDSGTLPFIGATEQNNGITNWIATPNETLDHNVLGVNYNGSIAEAFFHPYNCVFSDDVKRLHLKDIHHNEKYILLFCSVVIRKQKIKYTYGYKFNGNRMAKQKILLPITDTGKPDYVFMEQYIREREKTMLQRYTNFVDNIKNRGGGGDSPFKIKYGELFISKICLIQYKEGNDLSGKNRKSVQYPMYHQLP